MNKLAQYLNQHLAGEVVTQTSVLQRYANDHGPLAITPDMVAFPRTTSDLRKLLRFSWQLADKGYSLSITPRGGGTSSNGSALGGGVVVDTARYMNTIYEVDSKQRLIRLQPGATVTSLASIMATHGLYTPQYDDELPQSTIGGISAESHSVEGDDWIDQLEVVLANGDLMQTKRLSKRELNRKKGEQGFEADIYRAVDALIDDNKELIDQLDTRSAAGYAAIQNVKKRDGSLDLTPLFYASQGTLGIISEMIISGQAMPVASSAVAIGFAEAATARDTLDDITKMSFSRVEYFDKTIIERASKQGKPFDYLATDEQSPEVIILLWLDDTSTRARNKKQKKIEKILVKRDAKCVVANDIDNSDYASLLSLKTLGQLSSSNTESVVPLASGMVIALEQFETFREGLAKLSAKHRLSLSLHGRPFENIWSVDAEVNMSSVGGKRALITMIDEVATLASQCGGLISGKYGEGRLQGYSVQRSLDKEIQELYAKIRKIFDPHTMLNPGVKQATDIKELAKQLRR